MLSDSEINFHRSFLSLTLALAIWNEDYTYQNERGGPPNRQNRRDSDPVYDYHVRQGPHWPAKPPGDPAARDKKYNAQLAKPDGNFEPLVITTKRGLSGQNFASAATPWELTNSVLCTGGTFNPVVNAMMEVTGHYRNVNQQQLIHPKGINFSEPSEYLTNEVPLYYVPEAHVRKNTAWAGSNGSVSYHPAPEGWESFTQYNGGIDILVLPNGEVIGAHGHIYSRNNGHAVSVMSPLDFWAPGSRLLASGLRALTNRVGAAAVKGFKVLTAPTKELALLSASRLSGASAGAARGAIPFEHLGRRTLIMGEDLPKFRGLLAKSHSESGFYDVAIHGNSISFRLKTKVNGKEVWTDVSVKEVAAIIGPRLAPGDKIRLLACDVGTTGGPAQQLANELGRTVWASSTKLPAVPRGAGTKKAFVPRKGGKFYEFVPERGAAQLSGNGGKVTANEVQGTINRAR